MAEFMSDLQSLRPSSLSFLEIDPGMEFLTHFREQNPSVLPDYSSSAFHVNDSRHNPVHFYNESNFLPHQSHEVLLPPQEDITGDVPGVTCRNSALRAAGECLGDNSNNKKRKPLEFSQSSSANSSAPPSDTGKRRKHGSGKGKKIKGDEEEDRAKEVVHVRARRGQATDSHSLAERVRRGKINERLRCLQDIVPGCYKTMGLAVMLDEIINYVQSLQHQVEFLSMKLTAASSFYDFNSESDAIDTMQRAKAYEAKEMERLLMRSQEGQTTTTTTSNLHSAYHP